MLEAAIKQGSQFVDGWRNWLWRRPEIEIIAAQRMALCNACPHRQPNTCGKCGCPLEAKTRANDASCPDGRW